MNKFFARLKINMQCFTFDYNDSSSTMKNALRTFNDSITSSITEPFSLEIYIQCDEELSAKKLKMLNDHFERFFATDGQFCSEFSCAFLYECKEPFKVMVSKLGYLSELKKLSISFVAEAEEQNAECFNTLIEHMYQIPNPKQLESFELRFKNLLMNADSPLTSQDEAFLKFIRSCDSLNHFRIAANYVSDVFCHGLNYALKDLPCLKSVVLNYIQTGANFSCISVILQNQSIEKFTYEIEGRVIPNHGHTPALDLQRAIETLRINDGLKSLTLDFYDAFEEDEGRGLLDENEEAYITQAFYEFLMQVCKVFNLQELKIKLPTILLQYLEADEAQFQLIKNLFSHLNAVPSVKIGFSDYLLENERISGQLKRLSEHASLKNRNMLSLINQPEYSIFSISERFDAHSDLLRAMSNFKNTESMQLDIAMLYLMSRRFRMLYMQDNNALISSNHSTMFLKFIDYLNIQFLKKLNGLNSRSSMANSYLSDSLNIFSYLEVRDIYSLVMAVGGLHQYFLENYKMLTENTKLMHLDLSPNILHSYSADDMYSILNIRFQKHPEVSVMRSMQFGTSNFFNIFMNAYCQCKAPTLLFPIQMPGHWVGISVTRNTAENSIKITIYDSANCVERLNLLKDNFSFYFSGHAEIECMLDPYLQADFNSSGAFLIENMYRHINQLPRLETIFSETVRAFHIQLLQEHHFEYFSKQIPDDEEPASKRLCGPR